MSKRKSIWRIWAKALGEKSGKDDREAETVAWIRTFIFALIDIIYTIKPILQWVSHSYHKKGGLDPLIISRFHSSVK